MPLTRQSRTAEQSASQPAFAVKAWSRRAWPRAQLRAHWPHLNHQQVELLKEVFELFDTDSKGYFTKDELYFVMEAMGGSPTPQEVDAVLYELDSNGDGVVDFPEFLTKFLSAVDEHELLSVFNQLAIQEGEGADDRVLTLTAVERSFQYVGDPLSEQDKKYLKVIFEGADKDSNGRLDIKEFTAYLERMDDELMQGELSIGGGGGASGLGGRGLTAALLAAAGAGGMRAKRVSERTLSRILGAQGGGDSGENDSVCGGGGGGDMERTASGSPSLRSVLLSKWRYGRSGSGGAANGARTGSAGGAAAAGRMGRLLPAMSGGGVSVSSAGLALCTSMSVSSAALSPRPSAAAPPPRLVSSVGHIDALLAPPNAPAAAATAAPASAGGGEDKEAMGVRRAGPCTGSLAGQGAFGAVAAATAETATPEAAGCALRGSSGNISAVAPRAEADSSESPEQRPSPPEHPRHHYRHNPHHLQLYSCHAAQQQSPAHALPPPAPSPPWPSPLPPGLGPTGPPSAAPYLPSPLSMASPAGAAPYWAPAVGSLSANGRLPHALPDRPMGRRGFTSFTTRLRGPPEALRQASVIQEAPEEGDSGYPSVPSAAVAATEDATTDAALPVGRASPPRASSLGMFGFTRLRSLPDRLSSLAMAGARSAGGSTGSGRVSGEAATLAGGQPVRMATAGGGPLRLGSAGDGRRGSRFSGLMAAVFGWQWSLAARGASAAGTGSVASSPGQPATVTDAGAHGAGSPLASLPASPSPVPSRPPVHAAAVAAPHAAPELAPASSAPRPVTAVTVAAAAVEAETAAAPFLDAVEGGSAHAAHTETRPGAFTSTWLAPGWASSSSSSSMATEGDVAGAGEASLEPPGPAADVRSLTATGRSPDALHGSRDGSSSGYLDSAGGQLWRHASAAAPASALRIAPVVLPPPPSLALRTAPAPAASRPQQPLHPLPPIPWPAGLRPPPALRPPQPAVLAPPRPPRPPPPPRLHECPREAPALHAEEGPAAAGLPGEGLEEGVVRGDGSGDSAAAPTTAAGVGGVAGRGGAAV